MNQTAILLLCISKVLEAGAKKSRQWSMNMDRQQDADVYQAMADEARRLSNEMLQTS